MSKKVLILSSSPRRGGGCRQQAGNGKDSGRIQSIYLPPEGTKEKGIIYRTGVWNVGTSTEAKQ